MKKIMILIVLTVFTIVALVFAAEDQDQGLQSTQKIMRVRENQLFKLERLLSANMLNITSLSNIVNRLAMETKETGEKLTDPEAKEITLAISSLAEELYNAATKTNDQRVIRGNVDKIKAKCGECHSKFRK